MSSVSERARSLINFEVFLKDAWYRQQRDAFDEDKNPEGIINLGTSENKLMFDVLMQKFSESKSTDIQEHYTFYNPFEGLESFRRALADFFNHYMKPVTQIKADNLLVLNGCGSVIHSLAYVLAEPGDGFLIPAPFYGGFLTDIKMRADVEAVPVKLTSTLLPGETEPFELSVQRLEAALAQAKKQGIRIRALLLCNPCNPFGTIYSEKLIRECLNFAHRNSIHVIMDEVYMLSIFNETSSMKNVLNLDNIPDTSRLHVIWGFSKDFCVSGFRCGVLYTQNEEVYKAVNSTSYFHAVSTTTQHMFMNLISDFEWLNNIYIPTNHKRLRECYKIVSDALREMGLPYIESVSGFFIWIDFRKLLPQVTVEEEIKLFGKFMDAGLYITPGKAFECPEPGWFRIIFATKPAVLRLAMKRFSSAIAEIRSNPLQQGKSGDSVVECGAQSIECTESASLENLIRTLHDEMTTSDWLKTNTAEKWAEENPELAKHFLQPNPET